MTDDHAFIDADGNVFRGRARVLDAWSGFFDAFPDYRNVVGDGGRFVHPKGAGHDIFTSDPQVVQKTINDVLNDTH